LNRPGKIIKATTIDDLPTIEPREDIVDFHARLPISQRNNLLEKSREKGLLPNALLKIALTAFGI